MTDSGDHLSDNPGPAYRSHIPDTVDAIMHTLEDRGKVEHICTYELPSREDCIRIIHLLQRLLFPGYFRSGAVDRANLRFHLGQTANEAFELLQQQITLCRLHQRRESSKKARARASKEAQGNALTLLRKLPDMIDTLDGDVQAAYLGDPAATGNDEIIICYPGFLAILIYRIAHRLHRMNVPFLPRIMTEYAHSTTGIDIHPGATIGRNFFVDHGTGVVIGETTEIGDNVKIYQGVTLGALSFPTDEEGNLKRGFKRHPSIEDDVIIYANATVLGAITIGEGSVVGGNVFLTHSVDPGSKVTLESPGHKVHQMDSGESG
ncbi:MAG: serine O-acetyltransferase EpsC [Planctomycetota bacterium]